MSCTVAMHGAILLKVSRAVGEGGKQSPQEVAHAFGQIEISFLLPLFGDSRLASLLVPSFVSSKVPLQP